MTTVKTMSAGELTPSGVESLTGPTLAAVYNELTGKTIKKFRDRATGISRVKPEVELAIKRIEESSNPSPRPTRTGKGRRKLFSIDPSETQRRHREGTKRGALIAMLRDGNGRTFEQVMDHFGWDRNLAYEHIWTVGTYVGWGVREDEETGYIRLTTKEEEEE